MKKILYFIIVILLLPFLLSGCNNFEKQIADKQENSDITLRWWAFPTFAQENEQDTSGTYEEKLIQKFEDANSGIQVELTMLDFNTGSEKLSHALTSKNACDVLFDAPGRIIAYGKAGYLADLNDMFDESFVMDVNNDTLLQACKAGNIAYMYPISSAPFYMVFNQTMLEDARVLDLVKEGWTVKDFTTVLEALHKKGYIPGSVFCKDSGGDQGTRAFIANLFDSSITNTDVSKYTIDNIAGIKAIQYMKECVDKGLLVNGTYMNGSDAIVNFVNGRASFSLLWGPSQQNSYGKILKDNNIHVVEIPFPSEDGKVELEYLVNGFCVMNNGNTDKIKAAKKFIRFLCDDAKFGPANVIRTGCIPVRKSFGNLYQEPRMKKIMEWTQYYAPYYNTIDGFSEMRLEWSYMLKNVMNGYLEPKKALELFVNKAEQSLN